MAAPEQSDLETFRPHRKFSFCDERVVIVEDDERNVVTQNLVSVSLFVLHFASPFVFAFALDLHKHTTIRMCHCQAVNRTNFAKMQNTSRVARSLAILLDAVLLAILLDAEQQSC